MFARRGTFRIILARFVGQNDICQDLDSLGEHLSKAGLKIGNPGDADRLPLAHLFKESFHGMGDFYEGAQDPNYVTEIMDHRKYLHQHSWLVWSSARTCPVGACLVKSFFPGINRISAIAVVPQCRNQGIGTLLLEKVLSVPIEPELDGRYILADVRADNVHSLSLFYSVGFADILTVSDHFSQHGRKSSRLIQQKS